LSLALEEEGERGRKGNQERGKEGEGGGWKVMSIFTARKINKTSVFNLLKKASDKNTLEAMGTNLIQN
jgi:hypothetical protein